MTNESKTPNAITNKYVVIDHWDDWPEDHISSISEAKFRAMENGGYKVLKTEDITLGGIPVSKQYFSNPSRNQSCWSKGIYMRRMYSCIRCYVEDQHVD